MKWLPIATAPRNGEEIDVWVPEKGRVTSVIWSTAGCCPDDFPDCVVRGPPTWVYRGWAREVKGPTHWMPIPGAPE